MPYNIINRSEKQRESGKKRRTEKRDSRPFIAIDGEGITNAANNHDYILLAASDGSFVVPGIDNSMGTLSFSEVITFLLELKKRWPNGIFVGYGFNYDVNMMLKTLGLDFVEQEILERDNEESNGYVYVPQCDATYYIDWKPGKSFTVKEGKKDDGSKAESITIYDTLGFFQTTFARALVENGIATHEEIAEIEEMKLLRSVFKAEDFERIKDYCIQECEYLVKLMNHLRNLIVGLKDTELDLDLMLTRWDGAGAIAGQLLKHYQMKKHKYQGMLPLCINDECSMIVPHSIVMHAYFGGRFEAPILGALKGLYSYDINSAYPTSMRQLPCLSQSILRRINVVDGETKKLMENDTAIYLCRVSWNLSETTVVCPFPFRQENDRITFPNEGEGWYWSYEVREALNRFGYMDIVVGDMYELLTEHTDCSCNNRPFAWTEELYNYRAKLKKAKDARQLPLKLGLNACYGKLAQGVGSAPYQDFIWAGLITSYTRAMILKAIYEHGADSQIAMIATDGLYSRAKLDLLEIGTSLGTWEYGEVKDAFIAGNGLMQHECEEGPCEKCQQTGFIQKVRGYGKGERIPWQLLREEFKRVEVGAKVKVPLTRFIGASLARHLEDRSKWCTWWKDERKVSLSINGRTIEIDWSTLTVESPGRYPVERINGAMVTLPLPASEAFSYPHVPKTLRGIIDTEETLERIIELEIDSE